MTLAVSKAVEEGAEAVICASTGNTSASAAAYAARAGLTAAVVIPEGKIAAGKLAQALAHGAQVLALDGGFDEALRGGARAGGAPSAGAGQLAQRVPHRRAAHRPPSRCATTSATRPTPSASRWATRATSAPTGSGSRPIARPSARAACRASTGSRPSGAAPLVDGAVVARPETVATAIRIGNPARGDPGHGVHARVGRRRGGGDRLPDPRGLPPAGGRGGHLLRAGVGGLGGRACCCAPRRATSSPGERVVCVLTGHGLKDPDTAIAETGAVRRLPADIAAVEEALFG